MVRLSGPLRMRTMKKEDDGSFTMAPGWPEQEKRKKPSKYYLRVTWGLRRPCWRGCSSWKVISRAPEMGWHLFRRNGCNCIHRLLSSAMQCFAIQEHTR